MSASIQDRFECSFEVHDSGQVQRKQVSILDFNRFPYPYKPNIALRVAAVALVVLTVVVCALAIGGYFGNFPHGLINLGHQFNTPYGFLGLGISLVLVGGGLIVFQRVLKKRDLFTNTPLEIVPGNDHWKRGIVLHLNERKEIEIRPLPQFPETFFSIDTSTLKDGNRRANTYVPYMPSHEVTGVVIAVGTVFSMLGAMVYNVSRAILIPFYILSRMAVEDGRAETIRYRLSDIPKQMGLSIFRVVKAPFYATALIFASIATIVNPQEASKIAGAIERDWNEDVSISEGMWVCDLKSSWFFRDRRENLGKNGVYLAKCKQPTSVIECDRFEEGAEVIVHSRSHALDASRGHALRGRVINGMLIVLDRYSMFHPGVTLEFENLFSSDSAS